MKVIEILKVSKKIVETLQNSCIRVSDVRYVALYEEYEAMVARGEKKSYAVAHLAEKYGISERKVFYVIKKFGADCKIDAE